MLTVYLFEEKDSWRFSLGPHDDREAFVKAVDLIYFFVPSPQYRSYSNGRREWRVKVKARVGFTYWLRFLRDFLEARIITYPAPEPTQRQFSGPAVSIRYREFLREEVAA